MQAIQVINGEPISTRHVAYYTVDEGDGRTINLFALIEVKYRHPQCDSATITQIERTFVGRRNRLEHGAATWVLLEAAQTAVLVP